MWKKERHRPDGFSVASGSLWQLALSKTCSCGSKCLKISVCGTVRQWRWEIEKREV